MPSGKIRNNNKETLRLTNFPRNHNVSNLFPQLKYLDNVCNSDFQRELILNIETNEDLQKYLLASGEIGQYPQEEIDFQVTEGRLSDAQVRSQLDALYKNVLRRQNPYEIVFKDISKSEGQNPISSCLLPEIESGELIDEAV